MAPPRQAASSSPDQTARDTVFRKFCSAIVEPGKQGRFKSLLNRDNRKIVCQLKSPTNGLNLLQIAVLLDDVATVEQLILLGADVKVALRQDDALKWPAKSVPYPCVLSERGRTHWVAKVKRLGMLQTRAEAISDSTFSLLHLAVLTYSLKVTRLLISRGHSDVNERAGPAGLTPLLCAAMCNTGFDPDSYSWEPMRGMVDLLLELGGDLNAVNVVGNDFVATAASAYNYGMWKEVITDPGLLAKCGRKHAGRTALQLLHCFISEPKQHCERRIKWWSEQMQELAKAWVPDAAARRTCTGAHWQRFVKELSEPVLQRILLPLDAREMAFRGMLNLWDFDEAGHDRIETNVMSNILQGVAVMPCNLEMPREVAMTMIECLRDFKVSVDCLLLPRQPGRAYSRLSSKESLVALFDVLLAGSGGDLSQYAQVLVQQTWHLLLSYSHMANAHPVYSAHFENINTLLVMLHQRRVDWTDLALWPQELVDGRLCQLIPLIPLLDGAPEVVIAICQELHNLGDKQFVNRVDCSGRGVLSHAQEKRPDVIAHMLASGANPRKQGSDWFGFLREAGDWGRYIKIATIIHTLIKTNPAEVFEDFQKPMYQKGSTQPPAAQSSQGAASVEEAPLPAADMAARQGHHREADEQPPGRSRTGAPPPAAENSLLTAVAAASGGQMGFQALLLPLALPNVDRASVLFQQCVAALNAVQVRGMRGPSQFEMRKLLEVLLAPEGDSPTTAKALAMHIPATGVTLLGHAVAWGYSDALPPLLDAVRRHWIEPVDLLDCVLDESKFHKPLFAAVVYGYDGILGEVLQKLQLSRELPAAMLEHVVVDRASSAAQRAEQMQTFVSKPSAGTESIDLLMCAASAGNASVVDALIQAGAKPRQLRRPRNRYYKSAMHAAVQYSDLAMLMWQGGSNSHGTSLPGSKQVRCVEKLLKAGAGMTREQLTLILTALPTLDSPKVARSAWRLLQVHVSVCKACQLLGCWGVCSVCLIAPYCSTACQRDGIQAKKVALEAEMAALRRSWR